MINNVNLENTILKKISQAQKLYDNKMDKTSINALTLRYWLGYKTLGQKDLLHKANFILHSSKKDWAEILFIRLVIAYELKLTNQIQEILDKLKPYRGTLKATEPALYACFLYFSCQLCIIEGKERAANKLYRTLEVYCKDDMPALNYTMLASINIAFEEYEDALMYLELAHQKNDTSPFFFVCSIQTLQAIEGNVESNIVLPTLRWALQNNLYISNIATKNQGFLMHNMHLQDAIYIYKAYGFDWVLHFICKAKMQDYSISELAFYYYKEAQIRQINFPELYSFLIHAAYENDIEDVSRYALLQYLSSEDISYDILPFVYHVLLKNSKVDDIKPYKHKLIQFAVYSIENRLVGRYYYSLYSYLIEASFTMDIDEGILSIAENAIKDIMFAYEIKIDNPLIKKMLLKESFRKNENIIDIKTTKIRFNALKDDIIYFFFDETMRSIIEYTPKFIKLVENVSINLLEYFFEKKYYSTELLVVLCNHYINIPPSVDAEHRLAIYERVLNINTVSAAFKMKVNVALGNFYAVCHNFKKAVSHYKDINENMIDEKNIEQMLLAYIHAEDLEQAAKLIIKKSEYIQDKNLFYAIRHIYKSDIAKLYAKSLSRLAYNQLILGWYDKNMVNFVMQNLDASLEQWIKLAKSLVAISINLQELNHIILDQAIYTRKPNKDVQAIFVKMTNEAENEIIVDFASYLAYEILKNNFSPEYDTIFAIETVYNKKHLDFLGYALLYVYISKNMYTTHSEQIIKKMIEKAEQNEIFLPIFKDIKDKNYITTYIEKNTPFIYYGSANEDISLYYRFDKKNDYIIKPMKYIGFGIFNCFVTQFYGENIEYCFVKTERTGSISTTPENVLNNKAATYDILDTNRLNMTENTIDLYYIINTALVYEQMFKYANVEAIITEKLKPIPEIRGNIIT